MNTDRSKKQNIPSADDLLGDEGVNLVAASAEDLAELDRQQAANEHDPNPTGQPAGSVADLKQKLDAAEKESLRIQADMENFRKRTRRDTQEQIRYATMPLISELVEAIDNLQRAIEAAEQQPSEGGLLEGVKMVSQQLMDVLQQHGCQRIESVGTPFDPNFHEAIQMQPSNEFAENVISLETRSGYRLHDRVIRPAQVIVSTGPKG